MESAAVSPCVYVADVINVNGSCLNITAVCPVPYQTVPEVLMEDVGTGVVVVENLRGQIKATNGAFMNVIMGRFLQHYVTLKCFI